MRLSGKAADLLADIVIVTREDYKRCQDDDSKPGKETSDKPVTKQDKRQTDVLELLDLLDSGETKGYDFYTAIETLNTWVNDKARTIVEDDKRRIVDLKIRRLLVDYSLLIANQKTAKQDLYGLLKQCLEAVATGMVFTFDLEKNADDFNGAVLDCILHSLVHEKPAEQAWLRIR